MDFVIFNLIKLHEEDCCYFTPTFRIVVVFMLYLNFNKA